MPGLDIIMGPVGDSREEFLMTLGYSFALTLHYYCILCLHAIIYKYIEISCSITTFYTSCIIIIILLTLQLYVLDHALTLLFWFRSLSVVSICDHKKRLLIVTREIFFFFLQIWE